MLVAVIRGTRGMVATVGYNTGDTIHRLAGRVTGFPSDNTLALSSEMHIQDPRVRWVRSSDTPTADIVGGVIYARTRIDVGTEITVPRQRRGGAALRLRPL